MTAHSLVLSCGDSPDFKFFRANEFSVQAHLDEHVRYRLFRCLPSLLLLGKVVKFLIIQPANRYFEHRRSSSLLLPMV
jgi:hypothetical protein